MQVTGNTEELYTSAQEKLYVYIREKKMRYTLEREKILAKIFTVGGTFDAELLHHLLEEDGYNVSIATIYNTLALFHDCQIIKRTRHESGLKSAVYKIAKEDDLDKNCYRIICDECGQTRDIIDTEFQAYINSKRFNTFTMSRYALLIHGICNNCLRKQKKNQ